MWTTPNGRAFIVIGENIHATRVVLRGGKHIVTGPDGREAIRFAAPDGAEGLLPVPDAIRAGQDFAQGRVKLVAAAIKVGMAGGPDAEAGLEFIQGLAVRQIAAGADYLDLNVDEVSAEPAIRKAAMEWLVEATRKVATVALALEESSAEITAARLDAHSGDRSKLLLNSASVERLEVLDLAAAHGCAAVLSAVGPGSMPTTAEERVANGRLVVEAALERGLPLDRLHVDALVLPVAVDPDAGRAYLDAITALRAAYGPRIHLTGGFSNVSFGLPARRLLNDTFLGLAAAAGADSGIVDPSASDAAWAFREGAGDDRRNLAVALLTGSDAFGGDFLAAYRAGALA